MTPTECNWFGGGGGGGAGGGSDLCHWVYWLLNYSTPNRSGCKLQRCRRAVLWLQRRLYDCLGLLQVSPGASQFRAGIDKSQSGQCCSSSFVCTLPHQQLIGPISSAWPARFPAGTSVISVMCAHFPAVTSARSARRPAFDLGWAPVTALRRLRTHALQSQSQPAPRMIRRISPLQGQ